MPSKEISDTLASLKRRNEEQGERGASVEGQRRNVADLFGRYRPAPDLRAERVDAGGVPADLLAGAGIRADRAVLYLHGGGYVSGSAGSHRELASRIGRAAGAGVLVPDYRLAPEHAFPAAHEDALAAYRWLVGARGVAPSAVALAGDSAGAGLAAAVLLMIRDEGLPAPAAGVLLSPWADMTLTAPSIAEKAEVDPMSSEAGLRVSVQGYARGRDPRDPLLSPVFADLSRLPPVLVFTGTLEILHDDARRLADGVRAAGGEAEIAVGEGLFHVWPLVADAPEARDAMERIGAFLRARRRGGAAER